MLMELRSALPADRALSIGAMMLAMGVMDARLLETTGSADERMLWIGPMMLSAPLTEADDNALSMRAMILGTGTEPETDKALSMKAMRLDAPLIEAEESKL